MFRFSLISVLLVAGCGAMPDQPDASVEETADAGSVDAGSGPAFVDPGVPDGMPSVPANVSRANADCSNGRRVYVHSAVDGDTLQLSNYVDGHRERIRMVGIDTPESTIQIECYGHEASDFTKGMLTGKWICLTYDPAVTTESNNIDAYGRTLGYVFFGENYSRFYNAEVVYRGYANDFAFTDGAVYESYFRSLERNAYNAKRGLWTACQ